MVKRITYETTIEAPNGTEVDVALELGYYPPYPCPYEPAHVGVHSVRVTRWHGDRVLSGWDPDPESVMGLVGEDTLLMHCEEVCDDDE